MAEYMHVCTACGTYYTESVATMVRNGKCKCGASLVASNVTVEQYAKHSAAQTQKSVSAPSASAQIKYRKKPVPEEYNVPDSPASSGCLLSLSGLGLAVYAVFEVLDGNIGSAVFAACAFIGIYIFLKMYDCLSAAVAHLGAIRWLLIHRDEVEPIPPQSSTPSPQNKPDGPQLSNKSFTIICVVLLVILVVGLILASRFYK